MNKEFHINNGRGFANFETGKLVTFEVQGVSEREEINRQQYLSIYSKYSHENNTMRLGDFIVPMWGDGHNLYPQEVYSILSENGLLPELVSKQVKFLYGKGLRLYKEVIQGEGNKQHRVRIPIDNKEIQDWLESWEEKGFNSYEDYILQVIRDYYYVNTCVSQYHFNYSRRLLNLFFNKPSSSLQLPVAALSYIGADEARLAHNITNPKKRIKNADCRFVAIADWLMPQAYEFQIFNRFDPASPFKFDTAIAFNAEKTFTKHIYAYTDWFKGLFDWIKSANLSPKYLNSYFKNALNAHVHVMIPGIWYSKHDEIFKQICLENLTEVVQTEYLGVSLVDSEGKALKYNSMMIEKAISNQLREITAMMSGEGKNQGKLWASVKWGEEGWKFEEFPGKFKDFVDSIIKLYDKAVAVILAGKGISASITNIDKDGVISKSGSDVYYNYLLYVMMLIRDEDFVLKDLRRALKYNFPKAAAEGIKIGFWIDIPAKLQDTTPADRPQQTATADTKSNIQTTEEQK
jgi:hypothetical protein